MKKIRDNHGITLISLAVTIVIMMILAVSLTASMTSTIELKKYNSVKEDIIALTEEVKVYYIKNLSLPVYNETTIDIPNKVYEKDRNPNDSGNYYPINVDVLSSDLSLNLGEGNKKQNFTTDDLYVVNEKSLTVYYVQGAMLDGERHYTIVDDFSGGSFAEEYYSKVDLPIISVVTMESNGKDKSLACTGDTVTLKMLSNYNFETLPTVTINNTEVSVNWNGKIGTASYTIPFSTDEIDYGEAVTFSISGYTADGRNGEEITKVNFGQTVYRYAETLVTAFKNGDLQVGDYVNYQNPTTGEYVSYTTRTGYDSNQTYTTSNDGTTVNWRILGLSEDGNHLLLTSGSPLKKEGASTSDPYYHLYGATGMVNFKDELDNICEIYENSYADSVRSLTLSDINRLCDVTVDVANGKVYKNSDPEKNNIDGWGNIGTTQSYTGQYASPEDHLAGITSDFSKTSDAYYYYGPDAISSTSTLYDVLFANTDTKAYWLASCTVFVGSEYCGFGPGGVGFGGVGSYDSFHLCHSVVDEYELYTGVRPVVTLKADVKYGEIVKIDSQIEETW